MINISQEEIIKNWGEFDMEKPLVCIRCMTYNQEKFIAQALDGFLMQKTNFSFQIVVHDDCSTDNTAKIVKEYADKYPLVIKAVYEEENQYSKGTLTAIMDALMTSKYIAYCEGDDYWIDENKLQMQIDFLEKNPDYTMCFHDAKVLDELNKGIKYKVSKNDREYFSTELYANWIVPTASIVCRKETLNFKLNNVHKFWAGDVVIVQRCAHMGRVYGFSKKMSVYRITASGVTWQKRDNLLLNAQKMVNHDYAVMECFPQIKKSKINRKIANNLITMCINDSNKKNRIKYFFEAVKLSRLYILVIIFGKLKSYLMRKF